MTTTNTTKKIPRGRSPPASPLAAAVAVPLPPSPPRPEPSPSTPISIQKESLPIPPPSRPVSPVSPLSPSSAVGPKFRVLIDRTSFDETEDYGVDIEALGTTEWGKDHQQANIIGGSPPVVMRNGKVRRRLQWRPKSMLKKKRPPARPPSPGPRPRSLSTSVLPENLPGRSISRASNDGSVVSEQSSKASKRSCRSFHSFASLETQVKSNTKKAQQNRLRFPMPRPNYSRSMSLDSKSLDTITVPIAVTASESATTIDSKGGTDVLAASSGINVGGKPPIRPSLKSPKATDIAPPPCPPANDIDDYRGEEKKEEFYHLRKSERPPKPRKIVPLMPKKPALSPLFKAMGISARPRANSTSALRQDSVAQKPDAGNVVIAPVMRKARSSSPISVPGRFQSTPVDYPKNSQQQKSDSIPELSGEDVERDRLVDLRIRVPPAVPRRTLSCSRIEDLAVPIPQSASAGGDEFLLISELRSTATDSEELPPLSPSSPSAFQTPGAVKDTEHVEDPNTSNGMFLDRCDDDDDDDIRMDPVIGPTVGSNPNTEPSNSIPAEESKSDELRFRMELANEAKEALPRNVAKKEFQSQTKASIRAVHRPQQVQTVPVDLDGCCFLEAEKNLQAIHDMASEHLNMGEYDEALEVFEEILRGQLTRYGREHFRVGTALHNVGIVHMKRKDYEKAVNAYKEAVSIRKKALSPDAPDVASSLAQLGVAYLERKMHKKAIAAFRGALRIRRRCLGPSHPKIAKILNNIGCALYELNALPVAKVAFEEALEIQRQNLRDAPVADSNRSNFQLLSIASTLSNIASIKLYLNIFDEASVDFQEALLIQQCVYGDEHPIPKQTEDSLQWIEKSKGAHATAHAPTKSQLNMFSNMLAASITEGKGVLSCTNPADKDVLDEPRVYKKKDQSPTGVLLNSVEKQLQDLQSNLDLACGHESQNENGQYEC